LIENQAGFNKVKRFTITLLVVLFLGMAAFAQASPQELCNKFTAAFFPYNEASLKTICFSDPQVQKETLNKLDEIYRNDLKNSSKKNLSISSRAVIKDGKAGKKADLFMVISDASNVKYELSIWGCQRENGQWKLGNKILLKKL
jgi:hypothetical protein